MMDEATYQHQIRAITRTLQIAIEQAIAETEPHMPGKLVRRSLMGAFVMALRLGAQHPEAVLERQRRSTLASAVGHLP